MSSLWDANKGKSDKKSLYQRLNYQQHIDELSWNGCAIPAIVKCASPTTAPAANRQRL